MIGYKKGRPIGQITEILMEQRIFTEEEIRNALKKVPEKKKKKGKR